ncbi:hypothetical protein ACFE04_016737 [Oxalis oulophora]
MFSAEQAKNLTTKIFKQQVHNDTELEEHNMTPLPASKASSSSMQVEPSELDKSSPSNDKFTQINSAIVMEDAVKKMNANENMVTTDPLDLDVGNSNKMNGLNIDKAASSCPIKNGLGKSCVSKPKKIVNEDRDVEPTTLVFGSSSVKGQRSARKGRATTPNRPSVYNEATERQVWLQLQTAEKLTRDRPTNAELSIFPEVCPSFIVKIKGTTLMFVVQLYVAKKLGLPVGTEVEICTQGIAMSPLVPLQTVADWWYTTNMVIQRPLPKVGDSVDDCMLTLYYGPKLPFQFAQSRSR